MEKAQIKKYTTSLKLNLKPTAVRRWSAGKTRRTKMTREETVRNGLSSEGEAEDERSTVGNQEYGETVWGSEKSPEGSEEEEMKKMKMVYVYVCAAE